MTPTVSVIVPTLGQSPWLKTCLEALRHGAGDNLEILVVSQGNELAEEIAALADRVLRLETNVGFAAANNVAIAAGRGDLVATVNDDAVVDEGWLRSLIAALGEYPEAAAVQSINLQLDDPQRIDGCGLAWNRHWQAVQIHHDEPATSLTDSEPREIFGVSATAAIYRRQALEQVADPEIFDPRLVSYYEDVDLAVRLRGAGHSAVLVPSAVARHAGSYTGASLGAARWRLLYGNRHLVLARLLGRSFWRYWPRAVLRDIADLAKATGHADLGRAAGILGGLGRAIIRLSGFLREGAAAMTIDELRRFSP